MPLNQEMILIDSQMEQKQAELLAKELCEVIENHGFSAKEFVFRSRNLSDCDLAPFGITLELL
jgi:hypothetical protein